MEISKKRQRISIFLWILFILFASGSGAFLLFMPSQSALAEKVAALFVKNTGTPCSISGPAHVSFFPTPTVTLYNVRVGTPSEKNAPEHSTDPGIGVVADIPAIQVRLSCLSLIKGEVSPTEINIYDPIVNLEALVDLFSALNPTEKQGFSKEAIEETLKIIKTLRIFDGRFFWSSAQGKTIMVEDMRWENSLFEGTAITFNVHGLAEQSRPWPVSIGLKQPFWDKDLLNFPVSATLDSMFSNPDSSLKLDMIAGFDTVKQEFHLSAGQLCVDDTALDFSGSVSGLTRQETPIEAEIVTDMQHVSLARWLGPIRKTPEIVQWLLDDISGNARLKFKDNRIEMFFTNLVLPVGVVEKATGVFDVSAVSLIFAMETREVRLERVLPFLKDSGWKPLLDYAGPPVLVSADSEDLPLFLYDISVTAKNALWEKLKASHVRVRLTPGKAAMRAEASGVLYGGQVRGKVVFDNSDSVKIETDFSNVRIEEGLATLLEEPSVRGVASGKFSISASGKDFSSFARTAKGTASLILRNGAFGSAKNLFPFETLEIKGKAAALGMKSGIFLYDGHWNAGMGSGKSKLAATLQGRFGVRKSSGKVIVEGMRAACSGTYPFAFLYGGQSVRFDGSAVVSYDQEQESAHIDSCSVTFPDCSLSGNIRGTKIHDKKNNVWNGTLQAHSPSARRLLTALGWENFLPPTGLGAMAFNANYAIMPDTVEFSGCRVGLDKSVIRGDIRVYGLQAKHTVLDLSVVIDSVDADTYFSPLAWSEKRERKAYDFSGLESWNAKGRLVINTGRIRRMPFSRLVCNFMTENGRMTVFFDSLLYGGQINGEWRRKVRASAGKNGGPDHHSEKELQYRLSLSGKNVSLKQFSQEMFDSIYVDGTAAFSGEFHGTVRTSEDILKGCYGVWKLSAEKGFFCSTGIQASKPSRSWDNRSLTEFDSAEQDKGSRNYFDTAFARGELKQGGLETTSISVDGPVMSMNGNGKIDLLKERINMDLDVRFAGVQVPIMVSGPFARVNANLKSGQFVTGNLWNIFEGIISLPMTLIKLPEKLME